MMTKVKKYLNACFLACIESFLKDHGVQIEQEEMIFKLQQKHLCDVSGVVGRGTEKEACQLFGILFSDVKYHYPIETRYADGSLLIGLTEGGLHCVRFWKQEENDKIIVMDPESGSFQYYDKSFLDKKAPNYHSIELMLVKSANP